MNSLNFNAFTIFGERSYTSDFAERYDKDAKVSTKETQSGEGAEF